MTTTETHTHIEAEEAVTGATEAEAVDATPPAPPRPKIDLADALTLAGRLGTSLVLGGLTVYIAFAGAFTAALFCGAVSLGVFVAAVRLMMKMRAENPDYIAWRAAQEEAERRDRAALGGRPS